jgi:hypothetical protein
MTNLGNPKKVAWTSYDIVNNAWTLSFNNYLYGLLKDSGK